MMLKYSVTIRKIYGQTRQQWYPWQPWWKFSLPASDWQLAANAGLDPFPINTVMQYTLQQRGVWQRVCPSSIAAVHITWPQRGPGSGCAPYRLCGHTSSRISAVNKSGLLPTLPCVWGGLSQSSQQEWKRQPHDNVTSPPFIPATQHSQTKQQQPSNLKKAVWFTADMTSITNTNPLPAPSRGPASYSASACDTSLQTERRCTSTVTRALQQGYNHY